MGLIFILTGIKAPKIKDQKCLALEKEFLYSFLNQDSSICLMSRHIKMSTIGHQAYGQFLSDCKQVLCSGVTVLAEE